MDISIEELLESVDPEKLPEGVDPEDLTEEKIMDMSDLQTLKEVGGSVFESSERLDALSDYLKRVASDEVVMANLTRAQEKDLFKVMLIDYIHLEPYPEVSDEKNVCKNVARAVVRASKGREAFAVKRLESMLRVKAEKETKRKYPEEEDEEDQEEGDGED